MKGGLKGDNEKYSNHYHRRHPIDSSSFHYASCYLTYTRRASLCIDKYETITHNNICRSGLALVLFNSLPCLLLLRLLFLLKTNILDDDFFGFTLHTTITACWTALHPPWRLQKGDVGDEKDKQSSYFCIYLCSCWKVVEGRLLICFVINF